MLLISYTMLVVASQAMHIFFILIFFNECTNDLPIFSHYFAPGITENRSDAVVINTLRNKLTLLYARALAKLSSRYTSWENYSFSFT